MEKFHLIRLCQNQKGGLEIVFARGDAFAFVVGENYREIVGAGATVVRALGDRAADVTAG